MVLALFLDEKWRNTQWLELPSIYDPRWCVDCGENRRKFVGVLNGRTTGNNISSWVSWGIRDKQ